MYAPVVFSACSCWCSAPTGERNPEPASSHSGPEALAPASGGSTGGARCWLQRLAYRYSGPGTPGLFIMSFNVFFTCTCLACLARFQFNINEVSISKGMQPSQASRHINLSFSVKLNAASLVEISFYGIELKLFYFLVLTGTPTTTFSGDERLAGGKASMDAHPGVLV